MSERQRLMLEAWAVCERERRAALSGDHNTIAVLPGTRLYRIVRLTYGWRLWLATRDFIHGTYMDLHNDGTIMRTECRPDEGDEVYRVRPSDEQIMGGGALPRPQQRSTDDS